MNYQASSIERTRAIPDMAPVASLGVPLHVQFEHVCCKFTLPETHIAYENQWLEDGSSFCGGLFSGAMLVSGRV